MSMEFDFTQLKPFLRWFPEALLTYVVLLVLLSLTVIVIGWILSFVRHGPRKAFAWIITLFRQGPVEMVKQIGRTVWWCIGDLVMISPRRVAALTWLAVKESIRRRVVVVFVVFVCVLLFAGWFIRPDSGNPSQLYISVVMTATSYLVLLLTLILCSLSLPADLKNRTLQTVVTKPVRASEIILGRILGFLAIGTVLIFLMGTISYLFVVRGLHHTHTVSLENLRVAEGSDPKNPTLTAHTDSSQNHFHVVMVDPDGTGRVAMKNYHSHAIDVERDADSGKVTSCTLGPNEGDLVARVPHFGTLTFVDRAGKEGNARGISVGKEWSYRSYIEGGTPQAAIWKFAGVSEEQFPDGLPLALQISVFRSWKGIVERGIAGNLCVRQPGTDNWVEAKVFTARDYVVDEQEIPRELEMRDPKNGNVVKKLDLFKDFVRDGEIQIRLKCMEPQQYFGVAQADVYIRTPDAPFFLNFLKGYVGIWLQMSLLTALGVFFSTFLSGPVALLSTAGMLVGGLCHDFLFRLATGQTYGGGPFESIVRLATQENVVSEMEAGLRTTFVKSLDFVFLYGLQGLAALLPDFEKFSLANFVANGFNIPGALMGQCFAAAAGFLFAAFVASYFCFKMREVAK
jgi:ABC-type transport system involved in multi-copper enzyme maturation permease subunit